MSCGSAWGDAEDVCWVPGVVVEGLRANWLLTLKASQSHVSEC